VSKYILLNALLMMFHSHQPIIDKLGRVVAVIAPPLSDPSYLASTIRACDRMKQEISNTGLNPNNLIDPKRGNGYFALNVGLSYGNGHTKPTRRDLGVFQHLADALLGDADIQRLASYQDGECNMYFKKN
jgi:hypothetical protein